MSMPGWTGRAGEVKQIAGKASITLVKFIANIICRTKKLLLTLPSFVEAGLVRWGMDFQKRSCLYASSLSPIRRAQPR